MHQPRVPLEATSRDEPRGQFERVFNTREPDDDAGLEAPLRMGDTVRNVAVEPDMGFNAAFPLYDRVPEPVRRRWEMLADAPPRQNPFLFAIERSDGYPAGLTSMSRRLMRDIQRGMNINVVRSLGQDQAYQPPNEAIVVQGLADLVR